MYAFCVCVVNTSNKTFSSTQTCAQSNTTAQIFCVNATARPLSLHARLYSPECFIKPSVVSLHLWKNNNRHCWILLALKLSLIAHQQVTHVLNRLDWLCSIFLSFFFCFFCGMKSYELCQILTGSGLVWKEKAHWGDVRLPNIRWPHTSGVSSTPLFLQAYSPSSEERSLWKSIHLISISFCFYWIVDIFSLHAA